MDLASVRWETLMPVGALIAANPRGQRAAVAAERAAHRRAASHCGVTRPLDNSSAAKRPGQTRPAGLRAHRISISRVVPAGCPSVIMA
jgi:hypothetical protein